MATLSLDGCAPNSAATETPCLSESPTEMALNHQIRNDFKATVPQNLIFLDQKMFNIKSMCLLEKVLFL